MSCCAVCRNVLEDADKLHAEGLVYKLYNGEFKVDVYFAVPRQRNHLEADLLDTYLKTDVSVAMLWGHCLRVEDVSRNEPTVIDHNVIGDLVHVKSSPSAYVLCQFWRQLTGRPLYHSIQAQACCAGVVSILC